MPHNQDAAFLQPASNYLPSPKILDYVYGAAVLKKLGEVTERSSRYEKLQQPRRLRPDLDLPRQKKFKPSTIANRTRTRDKSDGNVSGNNSDGNLDEGPSRRRSSNESSVRGSLRKDGKGGRGRHASGRHRKHNSHLDQEQDADNRVWRKLTDLEVDTWMAMSLVDDDMLREFEEEKEHRGPDSIRNWSAQVSP